MQRTCFPVVLVGLGVSRFSAPRVERASLHDAMDNPWLGGATCSLELQLLHLADPAQEPAPGSALEAVNTAAGASAGAAVSAVPEQASAAATPAPTPAAAAEMHDCSNDDSGLPLAKLKTEQRWTSAAVREAWDVTLVTQLSPSRRAVSRFNP